MYHKIKVCERTKLLRWQDVKEKRMAQLQKLMDALEKRKDTELKQTA